MNTNLKEKILELINNLSVKSYNKARVNNAIDKIVESSGGGGSDDGVPIFYVAEETNTLTFKLMQGKPKVYEFGDLQPIICIDAFSNSYLINASIIPESFNLTKFDIFHFTVINYYCENNYVNNFLALNVGDSFVINKSELSKETDYKHIRLANNKNFGSNYSIYPENLYTLTVSYNSNGIDLVGHIIKVDQTNHNLYLSIGDEVWKYSYIGGGFAPFSNITFVEVVQS